MAMQRQWDPTSLPVRPGLYINFIDAAVAQINGGARGTVAIPLSNSEGTAEEGKFYMVENVTQAIELFGADNVVAIRLALMGGARNVLVYVKTATDTNDTVFAKFDAQKFNAFVFDTEVDAAARTATKAWVIKSAKERKHFTFVAGGTAEDDEDPAVGNARTTALADPYIVNLVDGVILDGAEYSSGIYAAYIAGLIAGTPINQSITYTKVEASDVTRRRTNAEIEAALQAGSLVLFHDGENVKVERGLTTSGDKIRKISARQQIATDIDATARASYIGRLQNNEDGQMALMNAIKAYLEQLEVNDVLTDIVVQADPERPAVDDKFFVRISFTEIDSMEQIFIGIEA